MNVNHDTSAAIPLGFREVKRDAQSCLVSYLFEPHVLCICFSHHCWLMFCYTPDSSFPKTGSEQGGLVSIQYGMQPRWAELTWHTIVWKLPRQQLPLFEPATDSISQLQLELKSVAMKPSRKSQNRAVRRLRVTWAAHRVYQNAYITIIKDPFLKYMMHF